MVKTQYRKAGEVNRAFSKVSGTVAVSYSDKVIELVGHTTLNLPAITSDNIVFELTIIKRDAYSLTINGDGSDLINGNASVAPTGIGILTLRTVDLLAWDMQFDNDVIVPDSIVFDTKANIDALQTGSLLSPGTIYVMTDFKTKIIDPLTGTLYEGPVEQIARKANSVNTFEPIASSLDYIDDQIVYDDTISPLNLGFFAYQDGNGSTVGTETLQRVTSLTYGGTGFTIQLEAPLNYEAFMEFTFYNANSDDFWQMQDTPAQMVLDNKITIVDNGGNNYTFAILELDMNNGVAFDFDAVVTNNDPYESTLAGSASLGSTLGRIIERYDPITNKRRRLRNNNAITDTADFRGAMLNRAMADPSIDYPGLMPVYGAGVLSDLVEDITGSRGNDVKTVVVDGMDIQAVPIFHTYGTAVNVDIVGGIVSRNITFGENVAVDGYKNYGSTQTFLHYAASVTGFEALESSQHGGLFFGDLNGTHLGYLGMLYGNFRCPSFNDTKIEFGQMRNCITDQNPWYAIRIHNAFVINHVLALNLNGFEWKNGAFTLFKFEAPNGGLDTFTMNGNKGLMANCYFYTDTSFINNHFSIGRQGALSGGWEVTDGMSHNDLRVVDGISTSTFSQFNNVRGTFKRIFNNGFIGPINGMEGFGGTIEQVVADNPGITNIEIHRDWYACLCDGALTNVKFMMDYKSGDITQSVTNSIFQCELIGKSITSAILDENIVGVSSDGKVWKATYADTTGAFTPVEVT